MSGISCLTLGRFAGRVGPTFTYSGLYMRSSCRRSSALQLRSLVVVPVEAPSRWLLGLGARNRGSPGSLVRRRGGVESARSVGMNASLW